MLDDDADDDAMMFCLLLLPVNELDFKYERCDVTLDPLYLGKAIRYK
jgi:hypothetical protein